MSKDKMAKKLFRNLCTTPGIIPIFEDKYVSKKDEAYLEENGFVKILEEAKRYAYNAVFVKKVDEFTIILTHYKRGYWNAAIQKEAEHLTGKDENNVKDLLPEVMKMLEELKNRG